jgi:hypothetical protein
MYWIVVIAVGVALGILLGWLIVSVVQLFLEQNSQPLLWTLLVGYVIFVYVAISHGWIRDAMMLARRTLR